MKIKSISVFLILFVSGFSAAAESIESISSFKMAREETVKEYILDLPKEDYQGISELFEENGQVISTSKGKVNAKEFFYSFLPEIESANTEFHQFFINNTDTNRYAARFHFNFKLRDGEQGDGEYVDEFFLPITLPNYWQYPCLKILNLLWNK
ncbi:MAG: hypothetical protein ACRCXC_05475 [Legionella sp.]